MAPSRPNRQSIDHSEDVYAPHRAFVPSNARRLQPISRPNINYRHDEPTSIPRVESPIDHRRINRPNVNYGRAMPTTASRPNIRVVYQRQQSTSHLHANYRPRQGAPMLVAPEEATSIDWWPYPPWGQTAAALTALDPTSTDSSIPSTSDSASSMSTSPITSSSPSVSIITISALAPSSTTDPPNGIRTVDSHPFNLLYLLPVFAVAGLALGALTAFLAYRWYTRRRRPSREPTLQPGPPYMPAANSFIGSPRAEAPAMQKVTLEAVGSPSKYTRHGSRTSSMGSSWLSGTAAGSSAHGRLAKNTSCERTSAGLLAPPPVSSSASSTARSKSQASSRVVSPEPSSMFSEEDDVPLGSPRGIRKEILDRLKSASETPVAPLVPTRSRRAAGQAPSHGQRYTSTLSPNDEGSITPTNKDETAWVPGSGFRIVEEDAPVPPLSQRTSPWETKDQLRNALNHNPSDNWLAWTQSWSPTSSYAPSEDRFTAIPSRKSTVDKKSLSASIGSPRDEQFTIRSESSMLPASPPQITSPPLQSKLLFSPTMSQGGTFPPHARRQNANPGRERGRRLHAASPPRLPLPSTGPDSPYRNRLTKPPPRDSAPERAPTDASDVSSIATHTSPAQRHAARTTALSKVGDIVAQSYSERTMDGRGVPRSPTMFGAVTEDDDFTWAVGIEQRLAAMEDGKG